MTREEAKKYIYECLDYTEATEVIKALEQEPSEDCVSRKAVLDMCKKEIDHISKNWQNYHSPSEAKSGFEYIAKNIYDLPPVTPTRKKGKWIFAKTIFDKYGCTVECPSCHKKWKTYDEIRWEKENKFCPNCGAEMEGEV